jgi:hypothetical protein
MIIITITISVIVCNYCDSLGIYVLCHKLETRNGLFKLILHAYSQLAGSAEEVEMDLIQALCQLNCLHLYVLFITAVLAFGVLFRCMFV